MKTRDFALKTLGVAGVAVLICAFWLLATSRGSGRRGHEVKDGVFLAATSGASNLAGRKQNSRWTEAYSRLPLTFEENVGQTAQEVRYVSNGAGYKLFLTPQEAVLALRAPVSYDLSPQRRFKTLKSIRESLRARTMTAIRMRFEGANPAAQIRAADELVKKTNYFIGSDPKKWHANVPSYARVKYAGIYPGVDLVFYGNQRRLEYDFIVAPGADPKAIRLNLEGARKLQLNSQGDLVLSVGDGEVVLQKPVIYQIVKGERHEITGSYALGKGRQVAFSVSAYDRHEPLILDPVLNYSTYLGGASDEQSFGIAVDAAGNAFVAGTTLSTDFPTTATSFNPGPLGSNTIGEVFVTEINPGGTAEIYSTYIAGNTGEVGVALALDPTGKVYVTGATLSSDFPTTSNALKQSPNAGNLNFGTSFISKIDPTLNGAASLVYSSYIGGTGGASLDSGNGIAADANGNAYVTGITFSSPGIGQSNFPVMNAFQATPSDATDGNAFLTRIDTTQSGSSSLIYSTYLGGSGANALAVGGLGFADAGFGVAADGSSNAYIIGTTSSTDFPTANGFKTTSPTGNVKDTSFVVKIDTTKSGNASLVYSTYLGGEVFDFGAGIGLGPNNIAYVTGTTNSLSFPTSAGAFQTTGNTGGVAFVSLVDTSKTGGASLQYSTFLGGSVTSGLGIRADGAGNAYVAGSTSANVGFAQTPGALQPAYPGALSDGFVSKINPGGNGAADLLYSTFFGGNGAGHDQIFAIALDTSNPANVYVTGQTFSSSASFPIFPNPGAFQTTLNGTSDAFVAKLTLVPTLVVSPTNLAFGTILIPNTSAPQTVTLTNNTNAAIPLASAVISGGNPAAANADYVVSANTCGVNIPAGVSPANQCTISVTFKPSVVGAETANLVLTDGDSTSPQTITLTGAGTNTAPDFTLTGPAATPTTKDGTTLNFPVTVTPVGGFSSAVTFTCTSAPTLLLGTCNATTATPADGVTPVNSTVTVTSTAFVVPPASPRIPPPSIRQVVPLVLALLLLFLLPTARRMRVRLAMGTAMILFLVLAGCSGQQKPHTAKGNYALTIKGTSGNLNHTVVVNITIN